jgi:hypothetical protein
MRLAPRTAGTPGLRLLAATARGDDYASYRTTKALLAALAEHVGPTRYAARLRAAAEAEPLWEEALARVAQRVRGVTPRDANVATVTKWDPTLLRLSRRRGVQFPDRRTMPDGYPREDGAVIAHLEGLRSQGVTHIVFPSASLWWLEHYAGFGEHLDGRHRLLCRDEDCAIYELLPA